MTSYIIIICVIITSVITSSVIMYFVARFQHKRRAKSTNPYYPSGYPVNGIQGAQVEVISGSTGIQGRYPQEPKVSMSSTVALQDSQLKMMKSNGTIALLMDKDGEESSSGSWFEKYLPDLDHKSDSKPPKSRFDLLRGE